MTIYKVEQIFEEIPDDPDHIMMNIPNDICEKMGWKPGDKLNVTVKDGTIVIAGVSE